jgi:spore germination protein GerM
MRPLRIGVALTLLVAVSACGGDDDAATTTDPATTTTEPATTTTSEPATTTTEPATTTTEPATTTTEPATTTTEPATTPTEPATTTTEPALTDVRVYLLRGERLTIVHREVAGPAVLRGALTELLEGPTAAEATGGLLTTIPAGTTLLDLNLADRIATVDLNDEYEAGGGSMSLFARVAQVVFTATQFDNVDAVRFWMNGEPIDYLGGEGITLDEPQARSDTQRELTGGIIFDRPAPGSTVTSPFTVTGEGDVFEGDFPLEVRRDGVQLGDTLVVRAGAWGEWADFTATVTVDAGPGPIELVARDESGCGPPECPPPPEIVLPLALTG